MGRDTKTQPPSTASHPRRRSPANSPNRNKFRDQIYREISGVNIPITPWLTFRKRRRDSCGFRGHGKCRLHTSTALTGSKASISNGGLFFCWFCVTTCEQYAMCDFRCRLSIKNDVYPLEKYVDGQSGHDSFTIYVSVNHFR